MSVDPGWKAHELIEAGHDVVVATVLNSKGSSPRHQGSFMVFDEGGNNWGSVGGGLLEAVVMRHAQDTFQTHKRTAMYHFNLADSGENALGTICGGAVNIKVDYISHQHPEELNVPVRHDNTLLIFGAGHCGKALEPIARSVNFRTVVIDDRAEFADPALYPQAEGVINLNGSYEDCFRMCPPDNDTFIVILTRGHMGDYDVLRQALRVPHAYLGMIGSKHKIARLFDMLREEGYTEEEIASVYAPIGENIHAETPEEIAISIVGELIRVRSGNGIRVLATEKYQVQPCVA